MVLSVSVSKEAKSPTIWISFIPIHLTSFTRFTVANPHNAFLTLDPLTDGRPDSR